MTGPQFGDLHKFFESQYETLDAVIDEAAERVRALDGRPLGTLAEFIKNAELKESPGVFPAAVEMIARLLSDHEAVIRKLGAGVKACEEGADKATADFLTGLMIQHQKMAWMLRSYSR